MIEVTFWITGARNNHEQFGQLDKHTRLSDSTQYTKAKNIIPGWCFFVLGKYSVG